MSSGTVARLEKGKTVNVLAAAARAVEIGEAAALVTVTGIAGSTPRSGGTRMLVYQDGRILGTVGGGEFEYRVINEAMTAIKSGKPRRYAVHLTHDLGMCCGGAMEAYIEPLESIMDLVIYGGGHVGKATALAAVAAGFRITVVDEREDMMVAAEFPPSAKLICIDPLKSFDDLPWGNGSYHLIVTHDHGLDQALVEAILPRPSAWIGMIGSTTKVIKFFVRLRAAGVDEQLFSKLSAPVGLDIGAETPGEIAVSIVAELVRVRRHATQVPLPLSSQPIKARGGDGVSTPTIWRNRPIEPKSS